MRLLFQRSAVNRILRRSQRTLLTCALLALGYCGFVTFDSWNFQRTELRELDRGPSAGPPAVSQGSSLLPEAMVGRIEVRRLGLSAMVVEGTTTADLRRAAGHISGTGMPGFAGNVGIAAHRDTFFRPLRNVRKNDIITLTTSNAEYRYRVVSTKVVDPGDVSVLDASDGEVLTLVTCYPFYFVGSAPDRFIVRAERII
uniref:Sortase family protein n=1 Tax=Solibacter usitatus (strain Ellin6076) TaxID=234267 RepID=Q023B0_SOLUE